MSVGINLSVGKKLHNVVEPTGSGSRMFPSLEILNLYHWVFQEGENISLFLLPHFVFSFQKKKLNTRLATSLGEKKMKGKKNIRVPCDSNPTEDCWLRVFLEIDFNLDI